jgi:hypothetical protein
MDVFYGVRMTGPLAPYASGLAGELARLGFTEGSAKGQLGLAAHLSRRLAAARPTAGAAVLHLVFLHRDDRLDPALAQVGPIGRRRVRLVGQRGAGPGGGAAARRSAARWIFVVSPPERPSASRPGRAAGFLSFAAAPCEQVRGLARGSLRVGDGCLIKSGDVWAERGRVADRVGHPALLVAADDPDHRAQAGGGVDVGEQRAAAGPVV